MHLLYLLYRFSYNKILNESVESRWIISNEDFFGGHKRPSPLVAYFIFIQYIKVHTQYILSPSGSAVSLRSSCGLLWTTSLAKIQTHNLDNLSTIVTATCVPGSINRACYALPCVQLQLLPTLISTLKIALVRTQICSFCSFYPMNLPPGRLEWIIGDSQFRLKNNYFLMCVFFADSPLMGRAWAWRAGCGQRWWRLRGGHHSSYCQNN